MALHKNLWQVIVEQIPKPFRNKYILVLLIFSIWMFFFDSAKVSTQYQLNQSVDKLKQDRAYFEEHIRQAQDDKASLEENKEKFAREKYYMQKQDEDVFIFVEE
ncbi:MAG: hypothetical protein KDC43_12650 [Saprospiraceae bacterium]|nr:hypothetical protein [Saprospiraceae bacterium]MCB0624728.1 hypothetical protein [Saprospiraceae bacterium]MCB0678451.1 hypothetical protein [Saprospiraceae bacterium]MCB0679806.1 hypothetical protein [Saprospiraceae bacterium]